MWYLHTPDRTVPYDVTMKAVNDLYNEGYFRKFAISNYMAWVYQRDYPRSLTRFLFFLGNSWEVAEIVGICKANQYVMPSVYQGIYNAVHRSVEAELFPCLRKYGIYVPNFGRSYHLVPTFLMHRYRILRIQPTYVF